MFEPRRATTTINESLPRAATPVNGDGGYIVSGMASRPVAGTARVLAHSRNAAISSARVVESGTVCRNASISNAVLNGFFPE